MSFVCTKHLMCIVTICIHIFAPNTRSVFVLFDMHSHDFVSTRYSMIQFHLKTIYSHVICLHETLNMYCNNMYSCFRTKHSIRVCPAWYASRTSSFQHDTVWYYFISLSIRDDMLSCNLSAWNTRYVWEIYLCLRTKHWIPVCPARYASRTSIRDDMLSCHMSARNTRCVL